MVQTCFCKSIVNKERVKKELTISIMFIKLINYTSFQIIMV